MPQNYTQYMSVLGTAGEIDTSGPLPSFTIRTRGGDVVKATISETTYFAALQNLDRLDRDRIPDPAIDPIQKDTSPLAEKLKKYVVPGRLIAAEGIYQAHGGREWFDAKAVHVLYSHLNMLLFEHTHWWITQIAAMGDKWLNDLFHDKRNYQTRRLRRALPDQPEHPRPADRRQHPGDGDSLPLHLRPLVGLPDVGRHPVLHGGEGRRRVPARRLPQPQRRRPVLLLGLRPPPGQVRHQADHPVGEPRRPRHHPALRADLRPGRPDPVLPDLGRLGGAPRHPPHHRLVRPVLPRPEGRQLLLAHRLRDVQPPQPDPRRESIPEELELDRRPPARLPRSTWCWRSTRCPSAARTTSASSATCASRWSRPPPT